jgi:holo-[acyl-carrier protein] synthase
VNTWLAISASGRQTSIGPAAACTQSNASLGCGVLTIIGLGLDATDIPRIAATLERYGDRFRRRVFTDNEIAYCLRRRQSAVHFAGRFAAKEAAMKALGTGHTQNVLWRDIEVVRRGGPPQLHFHGGAARRFAAIGARSSLLTITHSDTLALAEVLLLGA